MKKFQLTSIRYLLNQRGNCHYPKLLRCAECIFNFPNCLNESEFKSKEDYRLEKLKEIIKTIPQDILFEEFL